MAECSDCNGPRGGIGLRRVRVVGFGPVLSMKFDGDRVKNRHNRYSLLLRWEEVDAPIALMTRSDSGWF